MAELMQDADHGPPDTGRAAAAGSSTGPPPASGSPPTAFPPGGRRWLRGVAWTLVALLGLFVLLLAAAWVFGPPYVKGIVEQNFTQRFGRPVTIGKVEVFPLRLGIAAHDLRVAGVPGEPPLLAIEEISVKLGLGGSMTSFAPVIQDYLMRAPRIHIVRTGTAPERFNFSDVLDRLTTGTGRAPPPFKVQNIRVVDGRIDFEDRVTGGRHAITDWSFTLPVFSNLARDLDKPLEPSLSARVDGAPLSIKGRTHIHAQSRDTDLAVDFADVDLTRYVRYLPMAMPLDAKGGKVSLQLAVALSRRPDGKLAGTAKGDVAVVDVALDEPGGAAVLRAPRTTIAIGNVAVPENQAEVTRVAIESPVVAVRREADGEINWQAYARSLAGPKAAGKPQDAASTPAGGTGAAPAGGPSTDATSRPWSVRVGEVSLVGGVVELADRTLKPVLTARLQEIALGVRGLATEPGAAADVEAAMTGDAGEKIAFQGKAVIDPLDVRGNASISGVRLARYAPYLGPSVAPAVRDGTLAVKGQLAFAPAAGTTSVSGLEASLAALAIQDPRSKRRFVSLAALTVKGGEIDLAAHKVRIANLAADRGNLRVVREKDGTLDVVRWSRAATAPAPRTAVPRVRPPTATRAPPRASTASISYTSFSTPEETTAGSAPPKGSAAKASTGDASTAKAPPGDVSPAKPATAKPATAKPATAKPATGKPPAAGMVTTKGPQRAAPADWTVSIAQIRLQRIAGVFEDRVPTEPVTHTLDRVSLSVDGFSTAPRTRVRVTTRATVNKTGSLDARGALVIEPPSGQLRVVATGIDIQPAQNYFADMLKITVRSGALNARGDLAFAAPPKAAPRMTWQGDASVTDFGSVTKENGEDFLDWKSLSGIGMKVELNGEAGPVAADIETVTLSDFFSRLIIFPDGSLNVQDILVREAKADAAPADTAPAEFGPASKSRATDIGIDRPEGVPPVRIGRVVLERGHVDFADRFIQPNYSADLTDVNGSVVGLSSEFDSRAEVLVTAKYQQSAPVEIKGTINPLRGDLYLDLAAQARDIELVPFTPYSQKYTGYGISKGKLSMTVKYNIDKRKLDAENRIFLDQLTFGEKVDSPDATKLPVLLAVALLKNSRGEIDINLPISGSLDDPQFSIGGLIVRVIVNLLVKVATAPFALISSLIGGATEELGWVEFVPGFADRLAGDSDERLATLAKALADRPQLKLDVAGRVDRSADLAGLQRNLLERKAKARKQAEIVRRGEPAPPVDQIGLTPEEYRRYLRELHVAEIGPLPTAGATGATPAAPATTVVPAGAAAPIASTVPAESKPAVPAPAAAKPAAPAGAAGAAVDDEAVERALLERIAVDDEAFRLLAEQRARYAKERLVSAGIAAERVFMVADLPSDEKAKERSGSRADFSLK